MALTARERRRLAGVMFLGIALLQAIAGQTLLRSQLTGVGFLLYWLVCLGFLGLAVATALLDLLVIRHEARQEQRELIRQTLGQPEPVRAPDPVPTDKNEIAPTAPIPPTVCSQDSTEPDSPKS
jgi:hypothetical protein